MKIKKFSAGRFLFAISALLAAITFAQFLFFYVFYGFLYENEAILIAVSYLISFLEGLFPIFAATAIFFAAESGIGRKALCALAIACPKILYSFPRYYLYFVSDVFNTSEALIISALVSILYILYAFLQTFICIIILNFYFSRSKDTEIDTRSSSVISLDSKANFAILLEVLLIFVIFFAKECFNTISYFLEVGSGYTGIEIITIVISFLILPIFAFLHYLICAALKNRIFKHRNELSSAQEIEAE